MRHVIVTGATDGIGFQTALELGKRQHAVWVHGRTLEKATRACRDLERAVPDASFTPLGADFESLDEVRELARTVRDQGVTLHVLINNAGIFMHERRLGRDGHELTVTVNHLAPFVLTLGLLPCLHPADDVRIVNVASVAHTRGAIAWDDMSYARSFSGYKAYAASKLMNVLFTGELSRRVPENVSVFSIHPGVITTKLLREGFGAQGAPVATGAATTVHAATDPNLRGRTNAYFSDCREALSSSLARDEAMQKKLWSWSEAVTAPA